jgi:subtilisin family serine protease
MMVLLSPVRSTADPNIDPGRRDRGQDHLNRAQILFRDLPLEIQKKMNIDIFLLVGYSLYQNEDSNPYGNIDEMFSVRKDGTRKWVSLLVESNGGDPGFRGVGAESILAISGNIFAIELLPEKILSLAQLQGVVKVEAVHFGQTLLNKSTAETNIQQAHSDCDLKGQGVVVGIVDTGIDVNHPDFQGPSGTRIEWLRDYGLGGNPFQDSLGTNEFHKPLGTITAVQNVRNVTLIPS